MKNDVLTRDGLWKLIKSTEYRHALDLPEEVTEEYEDLAQGEYNRNYFFIHPKTKKRLVLRVNYGSQMKLEKQISYEYHALCLLEASGRTPKVYYVDDTRKYLNKGVLVMEYLSGESLIYEKDSKIAMEILADIHSIRLKEDCGLICPKDPLKAMLEECGEMFAVYENSALAETDVSRRIRAGLDRAWRQLPEKAEYPVYRCIVNTEVNSTNFLINGEENENYLIDWEKPIFGDPAQDIGHFLAPTTTFWKSDVIFTWERIEELTGYYMKCVANRFDTRGLKERILTLGFG